MKRFILLTIICFIALIFFEKESSAQIDLKINPIGLLFSNPDLSAEFILSENMGVEAKLGFQYGKITQLLLDYRRGGFTIAPNFRYYFNPDENCDKFYAGIYTKFASTNLKYGTEGDFDFSSYKNTRLAIGFMAGFKWVANSGLVFDINTGIGRALLNNNTSDILDDFALDLLNPFNIDFIGTIGIGYRIGG